MNEAKWTDLEIKLAYMEKALKDQNAVIYRQQKQIDVLEKTVKMIKDRVKAVSEFSSQEEIPDEKPPHY